MLPNFIHDHSPMQLFTQKRAVLLSLILVLFAGGCATLMDIAGQVQKPSLSVADVHITDFSFQEIELTYDIQVTNPNPVALDLVSYGYDLAINGNTFVQGTREKGLTIDASDKSIIQVPVRLNFNELYQLFGNLGSKDQASYKLAADLAFDLPVLGKTTLPITKKGTLPLLKMPDIELTGLKVKNMSLAQTDLVLNLQMDNPNGFGLLVNALSYSLNINGTQWVEGVRNSQVKIGKNGKQTIQIPISLNTLKIGASAIQLLQGNQDLHFQFDGSMDIGTTHPLLDQTRLIFDKAGELPILN